MRLSLAKKKELMRVGEARVEKADGGYFFYWGTNKPLKLNKEAWEVLEYYQWELSREIKVDRDVTWDEVE